MKNEYMYEGQVKLLNSWDDCDLNVKWENGQANIHMCVFFPCEQSRLKKFMKLIIDKDYKNQDAHYERITTFLESAIRLEKEDLQHTKEQFLEADGQFVMLTYSVNDTKTLLKFAKDNKAPKAEKDKLKDELKTYQEALRIKRTKCNDLIQKEGELTREISYLERNLETIKQRR